MAITQKCMKCVEGDNGINWSYYTEIWKYIRVYACRYKHSSHIHFLVTFIYGISWNITMVTYDPS